MATPHQDNEIELLEFLTRWILITKENIKIIFLALITGTLLGFCYNQFTPKTYESQLQITSGILTESYSKALFENINQLIKEKNITLLAQKLNMSTEDVRKVISLKTENALLKSEGLTEDKKIFLTIKAEAKNNLIWQALQDGIISFIEKNDFVLKRVEQKKKNNSNLIKAINKELEDLNNLKTTIREGKATLGNGEKNLLLDLTNLHSEVIQLSKDKEIFMNELELANSVHVIEGFTAYNKPASPKLSVSLAVGASLGLFFIAILIALKGIHSILRFSEEKLGKD